MAMKVNQGKPEAAPQPKIITGDIWQDNFGAQVLIIQVAPNRVSYVRDGYAHPCFCSPDRLRREYSFAVAGGLTETEIEMAEKTTKTPADRVAAIRERVQNKNQEGSHE